MYRPQHPSNKIVAEVAWMYYVKNLNQGEIADALSLSRPTVISYLKLAKERNIVCIQVAPEHYRVNAMADALTEKYGLKSVHVVPDDGMQGEMLTRAVCEVAAHHLPNFLQKGDVLGVSWGQTVSFVSEYVPHWPIEDLTVRQLLGSIANPLLSTSESCTTEIARRLDAYCINFNAPAVCSSAALATALKAEPIIREQLENLHKCNKSIFSLSPCTPDTHVVQFKIATVEEIDEYRNRGAVGIIAGRFIDEAGQAVLGDLDERIIGADHDLLRKMEGLLVVSGVFKLDAARAALRGGFVDHLVTDTKMAELLTSTD
ncbi:sugar-binding transcriptional regulator [Rhizobium sp. S153]|uniref:Sugar-binding transcriptional regulator n=1 Tax=Ciceribacter sichuanensis TaxID=2949647 RepID=A0ABT0VBW1_9HYPH|nr:sugar-binding transcriptional regulator [Ciceribacter sp. S153]MCM2403365.1 sugar-binding transcriptional regulator [Ciceribacter sp. S153]